jgi:hypothetical protein
LVGQLVLQLQKQAKLIGKGHFNAGAIINITAPANDDSVYTALFILEL